MNLWKAIGSWARLGEPTPGSMVAANQPSLDDAPVNPAPDLAKEQPAPFMGQEFGVSQEVYNTRFELYQYTPDVLLTKKGFRILEQMYTDDQVFMALSALKIMRLSGGYEIEEVSDDPLDLQIADEVAANLEALDGSLQDTLFSLMGALEMGWSLHEKVWDFWQDGPHKGHVRLKAIKAKNPQWFNPTVDDFNNLTGVVMISPPCYGRKLPLDKFIVYSFQKRYENIFGTSRVRALYDWWYIKGLAKQALAVLARKYGRKTPMGVYPPTMQADQKTAFLNALVKMGTEAAILMPQGCTVNFADALQHGAEGLLAIIEKADQNIVRVALGQTQSTGTSSGQSHKGGSQAGGGVGGGGGKGGASLQERTLEMYLDYIARDQEEKPLAQVIKDIVDYNYRGVTKYPRFKYKPLTGEDLSASIAAFIQAAAAQVVKADGDDEQHIREALGFPTSGPKNALRKKKAPKPVQETVKPKEPIDPRAFPAGGYRPPTPTAPGLPANFAESSFNGRKLGRFERWVDFAEAQDIQDKDGVEAIAGKAADLLRSAVDRCMAEVQRRGLADPVNVHEVNKLQLRGKGELNACLRDGLWRVADQAERQARRELRARGQKLAERVLEPKEVMALIKAQAFDMAGNVSDEVLKRIQAQIFAGVKAGKSYKDIAYAVENAIAEYVSPDLADGALSGARLMTAIRTAVSSAYNEAKKAAYEDPELEGFVVAYQYSAVLDGRTTEWCADEGGMDGRIFRVHNPIWAQWTPPVWWNCRSTIVPITKTDGWDGVESDPPTSEPPEGFR